MSNKRGFTLVELMVVVVILGTVVLGMLQLFIMVAAQSEMAGNKTLAVTEAQTKLEEIRKYDFDSIAIDYISGGTPGNIFSLGMLNGVGVITVDASNTELIDLGVKVCWEDKYNRIIGEDSNLNGLLDSGEDFNGNGTLDCPVNLETKLTRR